MRAEHGHAERHQAVAGGQRALHQALDLVARMRHFGEMRLARLGIGLGRTVEEGGADAALLQAGDAGVGVTGRRIVVRPVDQRGDAMVELVQRTCQGGDMDVLGHEHRRKPGMDMAEILQQRPVGADRAQRRLPGVHVGIDQAGQHEVAPAVERLGVGCRERRCHRGNAIVLDQHVAGRQHTELGILRDDDA